MFNNENYYLYLFNQLITLSVNCISADIEWIVGVEGLVL